MSHISYGSSLSLKRQQRHCPNRWGDTTVKMRGRRYPKSAEVLSGTFDSGTGDVPYGVGQKNRQKCYRVRSILCNGAPYL